MPYVTSIGSRSAMIGAVRAVPTSCPHLRPGRFHAFEAETRMTASASSGATDMKGT